LESKKYTIKGEMNMRNCFHCQDLGATLTIQWKTGTLGYYCEECVNDCKESIISKIAKGEGYPADERMKAIYVSWTNPKAVAKSKWEDKTKTIESLLGAYVGMDDAKELVRGFLSRMKGEERLKGSDQKLKLQKPAYHLAITGPSGVGKTEFARTIASIYHQLGIVETAKVVETNRDGLIGQHVGHTGPKTNQVISSAMGGVLIIDEAPNLSSKTLSGSSSDFGAEAISSLMEALEKNRDNIVMIFIGYPLEMGMFLASNQGLASRIPLTLNLTDYTPREISQMVVKNLQAQGFGTESVTTDIENAVKRKSNKGIVAGNGRTARILAEGITSQYFARISATEGEISTNLQPSDVIAVAKNKKMKQDQKGLAVIKAAAEEKLEMLVGLENVKARIREIGAFQSLQQRREEAGLSSRRGSLHMTFNGDPGTGKTTVARIIGEYYRGIGLLSRGHFTEMTKAELVQGNEPTASTVRRIVKKALGGVLFIDEAYALAREKQGVEAIDTLIKEMEDHYEDLIVILAGYTSEMKNLDSVNPGLKSRIAYPIIFENYSPEELVQILNALIGEQQMNLTESAAKALISGTSLFHENGHVEGNGRWARNLFDKMLMAQAMRLSGDETADISVIEEADILAAFAQMPQKEADKEMDELHEKLEKFGNMIEQISKKP
jgi:SpoVK/Ycf46/Vps4 family AAA+-type ATPase